MERIGKGAEADIYLEDSTILKERIKKPYRIKELDLNLRKTRTKREARLISLARRAGVPTPFIRDVDNQKMTLEMSYIEGEQIKKIIEKFSEEKRYKIFKDIGILVGKLHSKDIIHGDLTTSNMILKNDKIYFIDFGLGEINNNIEAKGVDLLVFKKTLHATHHKYEKECFKAFLDGYTSEYKDHSEVINRLHIIERRGRYFTERF